MEYRPFGQTGIELSVIGLGGLLARCEGFEGHPPPDEKRNIYLRSKELGINLFDMGYGDEIHIPDELKGSSGDHHFSLKVGGPPADELEGIVDRHLANIRRDAIDILRVHRKNFIEDQALFDKTLQLKQAGKIRSICTIRHYEEDLEAYAANGPDEGADADLVIYNYVCRWQEPGLRMSDEAGKGVLIMKALGGQWIHWEDQVRTDWSNADKEKIVELSPIGEDMRSDLDLVYPIVNGPWHELADPGESTVRTEKAIGWILENEAVDCILVAVASVEELEENLGIGAPVG